MATMGSDGNETATLESRTDANIGEEDRRLASSLNVTPFARIAFQVNPDRRAQLEHLRTALSDLRSALVEIGRWDEVTSLAFNRSLVYNAPTTEVPDLHYDDFFNDTALSKAADEMQRDLDRASKQVRIPLTSSSARSDTAVAVSGVILVLLGIAYLFGLRSVARLARRVTRQTTLYFPWAVLWDLGLRASAGHGKRIWTTWIVQSLTVAHALVGGIVLGWTAINIGRLGALASAQGLIAIVCGVLALSLGVATVRTIAELRHELMTVRRKAPQPAGAGALAVAPVPMPAESANPGREEEESQRAVKRN